MRKFVVNLDADLERLAAVDAQMRRIGLTYERFPAVDAQKMSADELDMAVDHFRWWCAIGRPVRVGEIGCAMSHYSIYRKMVNEGIDVSCVFEDDVVLSDSAGEVIELIGHMIDCSRPQVVLLSNHTGRELPSHGGRLVMLPSRDDMFSEGYVLTIKAAEALLKANWPMQVPCDHWGRWVRLHDIELFHSLPTICEQNWNGEYTSHTNEPNAMVVSDLPPMAFCCHKIKRFVGKSLDVVLSLPMFRMSKTKA